MTRSPFAGHKNFNPDKDIPSLTGKVIFITGGTSGLGRSSIITLAKHSPAHIYFTGRNAEAAASLEAEVRQSNANVSLTFLPLDMTSLASVKAGLSKFAHDRLDILMCNAGIMALPPALSQDGYEVQFAVNHIAHGLIIQHLLPTLQKTAATKQADGTPADVRIIALSSLGWMFHPRGSGVLFDQLKTPMNIFFGSWVRYAQSKLANIVYVRELARRYPEITSVSIHPGIVGTDLVYGLEFIHRWFVYISAYINGIAMLTPEQGCYNQVWAAAAAPRSELVNGAFYRPIGLESNDTLNKTATDTDLAKKLWDWTQDTIKPF